MARPRMMNRRMDDESAAVRAQADAMQESSSKLTGWTITPRDCHPIGMDREETATLLLGDCHRDSTTATTLNTPTTTSPTTQRDQLASQREESGQCPTCGQQLYRYHHHKSLLTRENWLFTRRSHSNSLPPSSSAVVSPQHRQIPLTIPQLVQRGQCLRCGTAATTCVTTNLRLPIGRRNSMGGRRRVAQVPECDTTPDSNITGTPKLVEECYTSSTSLYPEMDDDDDDDDDDNESFEQQQVDDGGNDRDSAHHQYRHPPNDQRRVLQQQHQQLPPLHDPQSLSSVTEIPPPTWQTAQELLSSGLLGVGKTSSLLATATTTTTTTTKTASSSLSSTAPPLGERDGRPIQMDLIRSGGDGIGPMTLLPKIANIPVGKAIYIGPCNAQGQKHGDHGRMIWWNGDIYCGAFRNDQRHGHGTLYFASAVSKSENHDNNNDEAHEQSTGIDNHPQHVTHHPNPMPVVSEGGGGEYVGEWVQNVMHGMGTRRYPNGDVYVGSYHHGKRHGEGRYYYANGDMYWGPWNQDRMHGVCGRYYYASGQRFEGTMRFNKRNGKGKLQRLDGSVELFQYINDERVGQGVRWSAKRTKAWRLWKHRSGRRGVLEKKRISISEAVSLLYEIEQAVMALESDQDCYTPV